MVSDTAKIKVFSREGLGKFFLYGEFFVREKLGGRLVFCGVGFQ